MRIPELEYWALQVVDIVQGGQTLEDSRVELKRDWIEEKVAARQLAGLANAAKSDYVLWIVGLDEKEGVVAFDQGRWGDWWTKVTLSFDENVYPTAVERFVPTAYGVVLAILFDVRAKPFVIRDPNFGTVKGQVLQWEVPWREGVKTRSARRHELLVLLGPTLERIRFELLSGRVATVPSFRAKGAEFRLIVGVYAFPPTKQVVIPFYRCSGMVRFEHKEVTFGNVRLLEPVSGPARGIFDADTVERSSLTIRSTDDEVIINGPGRIDIEATFRLSSPDAFRTQRGWVLLELGGVPGSDAVVMEFGIAPRPDLERSGTRWLVERAGAKLPLY